MNLPEIYNVLIITISDRASRGDYEDLSGPEIHERLSEFFINNNWQFNIERKIVPDDQAEMKILIMKARNKYNLIITTGGTGIGPKDITTETIRPFLNKEIPGIMEFIRVKYGSSHPAALLSRGVAGIAGNSLVYTLPGSLRAVKEYMAEILKTLEHTVMMQYGIDTHGDIRRPSG
ncbi:MAG TPA: molybdenum cofactor biosynthesis protein [Bacteroidales bacterium]|nr:molybdenum cofactor biosynthesis protein [Bacteroidales bacterium]